VQVVASLYHACGLLSDGTAKCLGRDECCVFGGQCRSGDGASGCARESAAIGRRHLSYICALTRPARPRAGVQEKAVVEVALRPTMDRAPLLNNDSSVEITAGDLHTCGLRSDGSVRCWGAGATKGSDPYSGQAAPRKAATIFRLVPACGTRAVLPRSTTSSVGVTIHPSTPRASINVYAGNACHMRALLRPLRKAIPGRCVTSYQSRWALDDQSLKSATSLAELPSPAAPRSAYGCRGRLRVGCRPCQRAMCRATGGRRVRASRKRCCPSMDRANRRVARTCGGGRG